MNNFNLFWKKAKMNNRKFKIVDSFDDQEIYKKTSLITKIGQVAMQKEKEKNRKLGIPSSFSKEGKIYYELPDGTITDKSPFKS